MPNIIIDYFSLIERLRIKNILNEIISSCLQKYTFKFLYSNYENDKEFSKLKTENVTIKIFLIEKNIKYLIKIYKRSDIKIINYYFYKRKESAAKNLIKKFIKNIINENIKYHLDII